MSSGISARISLGPSGTQVRVKRGRPYYRTVRVGPHTGAVSASRTAHRPGAGGPESATYSAGGRPAMMDSSANELLARLNRAYVRPPLLTGFIGAASSAALATGAALGAGWAATVSFGGVALLMLWFVKRREDEHYSATVEYELEDDAAQAYRRLLTAFRRLTSRGPVWNVDSRRRAEGPRGRRRSVVPVLALPPRVRSNILVPTLVARRYTLYFFPDRLLVYDRQMVWDVRYRDLRVKAGDRREGTDAEALTMDGPYGLLAFGSTSGVHEVFHCADPAVAAEVATALEALA